jgi:hypothetical protein
VRNSYRINGIDRINEQVWRHTSLLLEPSSLCLSASRDRQNGFLREGLTRYIPRLLLFRSQMQTQTQQNVSLHQRHLGHQRHQRDPGELCSYHPMTATCRSLPVDRAKTTSLPYVLHTTSVNLMTICRQLPNFCMIPRTELTGRVLMSVLIPGNTRPPVDISLHCISITRRWQPHPCFTQRNITSRTTYRVDIAGQRPSSYSLFLYPVCTSARSRKPSPTTEYMFIDRHKYRFKRVRKHPPDVPPASSPSSYLPHFSLRL